MTWRVAIRPRLSSCRAYAPDQGEWKRLNAEDMRFDKSGRIAGADRKDFDGFHVQSAMEISYA